MVVQIGICLTFKGIQVGRVLNSSRKDTIITLPYLQLLSTRKKVQTMTKVVTDSSLWSCEFLMFELECLTQIIAEKYSCYCRLVSCQIVQCTHIKPVVQNIRRNCFSSN